MGRLDIFSEPERAPEALPSGVDWFATVQCQTCGEEVLDQIFYPTEKLLVWRCSLKHKSFIENFNLD